MARSHLLAAVSQEKKQHNPREERKMKMGNKEKKAARKLLAILVNPELFVGLFFGGLLAWGAAHQWGITLGITTSWSHEVVYTSILGVILGGSTAFELTGSRKNGYDRWERLAAALFLLGGLISAVGIFFSGFAMAARIISAVMGTVLAGALVWYAGYYKVYFPLTADDDF